jgi:hypothetical protein
MAYSICTKYCLDEGSINNPNEYIKQLYIKNKNWNPPPAPNLIEEKITEFEKCLKKSYNTLVEKATRTNLTNPTPLQASALKSLKNNKIIIIKPTDKNLGPAAMDLKQYLHQILKEHLLSKDYKQLTRQSALNKMDDIKNSLKNIIKGHNNALSKAEVIYFQCSFQLKHRLPIFYGLPKVHKTPMSLCPVVSNTNSFLAIFSIWLDHKMKELLPVIKSYIKNSSTVITDLKNRHLPDGALIFTVDAVSMYTNIDTSIGINAISDFLQVNQDKLPTDFPTILFLKILETVMLNNIFTFSDTFWL